MTWTGEQQKTLLDLLCDGDRAKVRPMNRRVYALKWIGGAWVVGISATVTGRAGRIPTPSGEAASIQNDRYLRSLGWVA